ncbi:MAG: 50S ribosomal protein L3 [Clostridiales bacterium]|jgi:large subunit ribosomal protein L3|nr:50S ribosomal protein L3 [Clostridiales bacterium]
MKGILGRKIGMTEVFTKNGKVIPVTVIEVLPNIVTQIKTEENDGYNAIQLAAVDKKDKNATKAAKGHVAKANTTPKRFLKEIRDVEGNYNLGDAIDASLFTVGEIVDVTGTSKGKGFQGTIKRHNQSRGPMTHGSRYHRGPGSLGTMLPKRVLKGKKLPGHMGAETITIQNLMIVDVNVNENYILVSGNVPGPKKSLVLIKSAVKNSRKIEIPELVTYEEEVNEVVEEEVVNENTEEVADEMVETTDEVAETEETNETVENDADASEETENVETSTEVGAE